MPAYNGYPQTQINPYYQTALPIQQPQQNTQSGLMTIMVSSEDEMINYPVAAGVTVLLISFPAVSSPRKHRIPALIPSFAAATASLTASPPACREQDSAR